MTVCLLRDYGEQSETFQETTNDLQITGKLWNTDHDPENVEAAFDRSLKDLQTDYLDLYLVSRNLHKQHCCFGSFACFARHVSADSSLLTTFPQMHWPVAFRHSTTTIQPINEETGQVDVVDVPISATWAAMEGSWSPRVKYEPLASVISPKTGLRIC